MTPRRIAGADERSFRTEAGRRVASAAALAIAIAVAAFLRLDSLGEPSYWLDEILHQQITTAVAKLPWWRWFAHLHTEHAALYYLTQLATRLFGSGEGAGRLAAALFGIATVPVVWLAARRTRDGAIAAAACAILLAVSPLHVYFSREARSYALLTFLGALLMLVLLRGRVGGRSLTAAALVLLAMLYTSAVSATIVLAALIVAAGCAILLREQRRWYATVAGFCAVTLASFRLVYAARPVADASWPGFPNVDLQFVTSLLRAFSVSALSNEIAGRTAVAMLLFAILGVIALVRGDRREHQRNERRDALVIAGMTLLPLAISLAALKSMDHFYAARYVMPAVFGYTMLAGIGVAFLARLVPPRFRAVLAVAIAMVTAAQMWSSARTEPFRKLDWRGIATIVASHARPGDLVLAAEPWADVSLRYYLDQHPHPPKLVLMPYVELAERLRRSEPALWLVSAGYEDNAMRRWMCGFPMVAASPLENFRLHYASKANDFLRERGNAPEQRAAALALGIRGFTLRMSDGEERYFGEGWALPEGSGRPAFRWAVGTRATLTVPRWGSNDRLLRMRVLPIAGPAPQTVAVSVNGAPAGTLTLPDRWSEPSVAIPARFWVDGWNTITLDFGHAHPPGGSDRRQLAADFDWLAVDDRGAPPSAERDLPLVALPRAARPLLDARTLWRRTSPRLDGTLNGDAATALVARLGYDPSALTQARLEDLVESIAFGQDCVDDLAFLTQSFAILLERSPNPVEKRDLLGRIHAGLPRTEIIARIVKSPDFERKYLKP